MKPSQNSRFRKRPGSGILAKPIAKPSNTSTADIRRLHRHVRFVQKRKWSDVRLRQCLATRFSWQPRLQCNDSRRTGIVFGIMVKAAISLMDPGLVANSMEKFERKHGQHKTHLDPCEIATWANTWTGWA
jgi:hypothetical protein